MIPGASTRPSASMVRFAPPRSRPTATIWPPATATEAWRAGALVPSTTSAFLMRRSCMDVFRSLRPRLDGVALDRLGEEVTAEARPIRELDHAVLERKLRRDEAAEIEHLVVGEELDEARIGG